MVGCITDSMGISLSKLLELVKDRKAWLHFKLLESILVRAS